MYTGLQGFLMRANHRILSRSLPQRGNQHILEIGGANRPHVTIVPLQGIASYTVSDTSNSLSRMPDTRLPRNAKLYYHRIDKDPDYAELTSDPAKRYTRIIASHCLEHIQDPEEALLSWANLLTSDGVIDLSIPCDPGLFWRLGQLLGRPKSRKTSNLTHDALDLLSSREHVNSANNLFKIIKFYTGKSGLFFPSVLPIIGLNLFIFFRLKRRDFELRQNIIKIS